MTAVMCWSLGVIGLSLAALVVGVASTYGDETWNPRDPGC